jgi:hypothetical protein
MPRNQRKGKDFLTYALGYTQKLGFRVFPLVPGKKIPMIPNWQNEATTDEAKIREWWTRWPNANIGIVTGEYRDGFFYVLDFDPRNGGDWFDDVGEDILPPTWVVHTARGGRHYYYRTRELLRSAMLPDGVDLKGKGGYVVAPPSILFDDDGNPIGDYAYQVGNMPKDLGMAEGPSWVLEKLHGKRTSDAGGGNEETQLALWRMPPPIPKGMRHNYLVSLAGALWAAGVPQKELEAVLWGALEFFETREDFEPEKEINGILKSLQNWQGEKLDLAIILRSLPTALRNLVIREVAAAKNLAEANAELIRENRRRAAEVVRTMAVRKKEDGSLWGVYQMPDGKEREVPYTATGLIALLQDLGISISTKEAERLLGIVSDGAHKGKSKKPKAASFEEILEVVWKHKWIEWGGETWLLEPPLLTRANIDNIRALLLQNGIEISKERLNTFFDKLMKFLPISPMEGVVVTEAPRYGKAGGIRGLWFRHKNDLYVVTPHEIKHFPFGQWPKDVYVLDLRQRDYMIDWNGTPEDLLAYWEGVTNRLAGDRLIALAMFLPALLDQGHIGLILRGPAGSGKSTLKKSLGYLRLGRAPKTPHGTTARDFMAVLHQKAIVFFDEVSAMPNEMQTALKSMITGDGMAMRSLYTDLEEVESDMMGTAVFCATKLEYLQPDLRTRCFVWELENKGGGEYEDEIEDFCKKLWRRALAGAIKLYQQAAKLPPPPKNLLPEIRFRRWGSWAYRYAQILGVADKFVASVRKSKIAAHKGEKFEFLIDALSNPNFDPKKEYTIGELIELADPAGANLRGIGQSLNRESVRDAIITLALSMGYHLRIEKTRLKGETKAKLRFFFTPLQTGDNSRLRAILKNRGIEPDSDDDNTSPTPPPAPPPNPPTPPPTAPADHSDLTPPQNPASPAQPPASPSEKPESPTDAEMIEFLENAMAEHDRKGGTTEQKLLYLYRFKERFWAELAKNGRQKTIDYVHKKMLELENVLHAETEKKLRYGKHRT